MMRNKRRLRVAVAMSGGVDSSVAAALLQKSDCDVTGFFMYFWQDQSGCRRENRCCSSAAEKRVRAVANKLKIPFYSLDFKKEFKEQVVDNFLSEYRQHHTPNPCVVCNREIKFGLLLDKIRELGFDCLATGHYVEKGESKGKYKLFKAKDVKKDQSYFLYNLTQQQLKYLLFPLGGYKKSEVRKIAFQLDLPVTAIKESQDICFVGNTVEDFVDRHLGGAEEGSIVDISGKVIGQHHGLHSYTVGQRKGVRVGGKGPYYVVNRDWPNNNLVVTNNPQDKKLYSRIVKCRTINWVSGQEPTWPLVAEAVVRYNTKPVAAEVTADPQGYRVDLVTAQRAVMPGQSVVFYHQNELLGGGIIKK